MHAILELKLELSFEDVQRLAMTNMDVRWRPSPAGRRAHVYCGQPLDIYEERDVELWAPKDDLASTDLDHRLAA